MKLVSGQGSSGTGACWMSAVAWYVGERQWTDAPECVCPILRALCININDGLPSDAERERVIAPHIFDVIGTRADWPAMQQRLNRIVEFAKEQAAAIDAANAKAAQDAAYAAADAADAAAYANAKAAQDAADAAAHADAAAYAYAAVSAAVRAAQDAAYAASTNAASTYAASAYVAENLLLPLVLELCEIGERQEVPQVRELSDIPAYRSKA